MFLVVTYHGMFFELRQNSLSKANLKKKDQSNNENYRAISCLNCFWKVNKRFLYDQLTV